MTSGIYKIYFIDTPNKVYIGSSKHCEKRKKQHSYELRTDRHINPMLQNAFNKYGLDKFVFEILEEIDEEMLIEKERFYYKKSIDDGLVIYNMIYPDIHPTNNGKTRFKKGLIPWNKNKTKKEFSQLSNAGVKKGQLIGNKNGFKKGMTAWNKDRKNTEEENKILSDSHKGQIPWFNKKAVPPPSNTGRTRFKKKLLVNK